MTKSWSYKKAGVDIRSIKSSHSEISKLLGSTLSLRNGRIGEVIAGSGHYAGVIKLRNDDYLALHTDGVGTKVLIAQQYSKFDTVGIDCIAMNVNDLICVGAEPISLVDYIALKKNNPVLVKEITKGLVKGAKLSNTPIIGGETAIMPDVIEGYGNKAFDLAASAVGVINKKTNMLNRKIKSGDIIIGLQSSGIHSNGATLARKVLLEKYSLRKKMYKSKRLGDLLLEPTIIYSKAIMTILNNIKSIHGLAHITGGAFTKLPRIGSGRVGFSLDLPKPPFIFELIQETGNISDKEMQRTFNMGYGFVIICPKSQYVNVDSILSEYKINNTILGNIVSHRGVKVNGKSII
uniref:Phosphoribosylformylglycinamidine cyclo-ligase n=1 Tax=uncultured marine crenarchaeote KM3-153-F8 TaxID=526665 RepID=B3V648_9ARCH|nr:phosphoribosylformylglycinamidine cyclo-ligase [uncultured marine crenarchaeote KM3-153-F8]